MTSPFKIIHYSLDGAVAAADARIAETNAADYAGTPETAYEVFEVAGRYGPYFEVAFTRVVSAA